MSHPAVTGHPTTSWLEAGVAAHRHGDLHAAVEAYRKALEAAPHDGPALNLLGTALLQLGDVPEAVVQLEQARQRVRDDPKLLGNLGQAYLALGRYREAADVFRKASRLAPQDPQLQVGIATSLALAGKLPDAETLLKRLTARFADSALVWLNLGHVFRDTQRLEPALNAYRKALALEPQLADARIGIGAMLHGLFRFDEASHEYRTAIASFPDHLPAYYNLASVSIDTGRFAEAEAICREMVRRAPDWPQAHALLGTALGLQSRLLEAIGSYRRAAELAPDDAGHARTLGGALVEARSAPEGLRWLAHAAARAPESVALERVSAGALLGQGSLQDGFSHYAFRAGAEALRSRCNTLNPLDIGKPLSGEISGRHVCVIGEQGLGDELFFFRYAERLEQLGARVTCRTSPALCSLLERVPSFGVVPAGDDPLPQADVYVLAGDLPAVLGYAEHARLRESVSFSPGFPVVPELPRHIAVFWPFPAPTLRIAPVVERVADLETKLAGLGPAPYIGVTWRAGIAPEQQTGAEWVLHKRIPATALVSALARTHGTVVALQRNPYSHEIDALSTALGRPVHDLTALNQDLEGMLALLSLIDEYVGVSNTNMHLRAAAGKTARVLVPASAEWRWMHAGSTSPWFPGFAIYRQSLHGDWTPALDALAGDLERCGA